MAQRCQVVRLLEQGLRYFAPDLDVLSFPSWDCQPYDRVSPNAGVVARRMTTLSRLATTCGGDRPLSLFRIRSS